MAVPAEQVARIPAGNLRVPRAEFAVAWAAANRLNAEQGDRGVLDWYAAAVLATCEWLACAVCRPAWGHPRPAEAPATRTRESAYEELIEAEYLAAERFEELQPRLARLQPGWGDGVRATLRWAWRHQAPPPLDIIPALPEDGRSTTAPTQRSQEHSSAQISARPSSST